METTIQQAEKDWHEALFGSRKRSDFVVPEAIRQRYLNPPAHPRFYLERLYQLLGDVRGKKVLVFGCGDDNGTVLLALKGAMVFAFDLSEEAIRLQKAMTDANGVSSQLVPVVCAAEELPFEDDSFDIVVGMAILHHIPDHLATVPRELARVLRRGGRALFLEPVIRSASFGRILQILPGHQDVSPGERQLTRTDLEHFTRHFDPRPYFYCFLTRVDRFICRGPLETAQRSRRFLVRILHELDYAFLKLPGADRLAGVVVLELRLRGAERGEEARSAMLLPSTRRRREGE